jgi:FkbM family methyltransferase
VRRLALKGYGHPLHYREGASDPDVILQVFFHQEYACVLGRPDIQTIIDCGANIGCAAFYLLSHYPQARLIAVEPDPGNYALCRKNLRAFGDRAVVLNAAVWSEPAAMRIVRGGFGDGRDWSFQVRPCRAGEPGDCNAVTIDGLMTMTGFPTVGILKIDVEGAEEELFRTPERCAGWLGRTRHVVTELHGPDAAAAHARLFDPAVWDVTRTGEFTTCSRRTRPTEMGTGLLL